MEHHNHHYARRLEPLDQALELAIHKPKVKLNNDGVRPSAVNASRNAFKSLPISGDQHRTTSEPSRGSSQLFNSSS